MAACSWRNSRLGRVLTAMALVILTAGAAQAADPVLAMSRQILNLDPDGFLIPGTEELRVRITITEVTPGDQILSLGVNEVLPDGWQYIAFENNAGDDVPQIGSQFQNELGIAWFQIPPLPISFVYRVSIPSDETGPATISGQAEFRASGNAVRTPVVETTVQTPQPGVEVERTISGTGVTGPNNEFFVPGGDIDVTVNLSLMGDETVTALGYEELLPAGIRYVSASGQPAPQITPLPNAEGLLEFGYFNIPAFPFSFTFTVRIPEDFASPITFDGRALYRFSGPQFTDDAEDIALELAPCVMVSRTAPDGGYEPGGIFTVDVEISSDCPAPVTTLALTETVPGNWAFVGVQGASAPDVSPAPGATGTLDFAWTTVPAFPVQFQYQLQIPLAESEPTRDVCGSVDFTVGGNPTAAPESCTTFDLVLDAPPVITLDGDNPLTLECGSAYVEPGFTAIDDNDGDVTDQVQVSGFVDFTAPGSYTLTYTVTDSADNTRVATRTVNVNDTTAPTITLNGAAVVTIECGASFTDQGATATDVCDGDISGSLIPVSTVDTDVPGIYGVTYSVSDSSGNAATPVTREVRVVDTTRPVITLIGSALLTTQCGQAFTDPGATAADACDGDLTGSIQASGTVNTTSPGEYQRNYNVTDASGNVGLTVTRTVRVVDTTSPVVTPVGGDVTIECGATYTEQGATATDACDASITVNTDSSAVDTGNVGDYLVRYTATDDSGNTGSATRTVRVRDTAAPAVTLLGGSSVTLECGDAYVDAGATANDACEGALDVTIDDSQVLENVPGLYTVTITAEDSAGNATTRERTVTVVDTRVPVIALVGSATLEVACGSVYTDAGATASDQCGGDLSARIEVENNVDSTATGVYTVVYRVSDDAGNAAQPVTRTVNVVDTTAPIITLNGPAEIVVECGGVFQDPGATAQDQCEGNVSSRIQIGGDIVDTSAPGEYTLTYDVSDSSANEAAQLTRVVSVRDTTAPVIELLGEATVTVDCDVPYVDAGATATDVCDPDVAVTIDASGVDFEVAGTYTVFFTAVDDAGEIGTATRTVIVRQNCFNFLCADNDNNGLLDTPFACLNETRNGLELLADSVNCQRAVESVTWFDGGIGDISAIVRNPANTNQQVIVSVPRNAIVQGEQGVLTLAVSCDLESLFAPADTAEVTDDLPAGVLEDVPVFTASLLISRDGGATFFELDDVSRGDAVATIEVTNVETPEGSPLPGFVTHPAAIEAGDQGLILGPLPGMWSTAGLDNVEYEADSLRATAQELGAFVLTDSFVKAGDLTATPALADFGIVQTGQSAERSITLTNNGGGIINGQVTVVGTHFSLVTNSTYTLAPGASQIVRVRFSPEQTGELSALLNITGDPSGLLSIQLQGFGADIPKEGIFLGCGADGNAAAGAGEGLIALLALGALLFTTRRRRAA